MPAMIVAHAEHVIQATLAALNYHAVLAVHEVHAMLAAHAL